MTGYLSGLCSIGLHEGLKPENFKGDPLPTCVVWQDCHCKCHKEFTEMFRISDTERVPVNFSAYTPTAHNYILPPLIDIAVNRERSKPGGTFTGTVHKGELEDDIPATLDRSFAPTATGRSARGELEYMVKQACDVWMVDFGKDERLAALHICTPKYLAEEIAHTHGIKMPSTGAIDAVLVRWVKLNFAEIAHKPNRFLRYTEEGIKLTLDGCKERARLRRSR